jgi:hypothetical protein
LEPYKKKLNLPPLSPKYVIVQGVGGVPDFFFIGILIFMLHRSPCTRLKPYDEPFWGFE